MFVCIEQQVTDTDLVQNCPVFQVLRGEQQFHAFMLMLSGEGYQSEGGGHDLRRWQQDKVLLHFS